MKSKLVFSTLLFFLVFANLSFSADTTNNNWPSWRGPMANGEAVNCDPPTQWSETQHIKWKTPIPGKGQSSPIIWGDQIFITTAIELDKEASKEAVKRLKKSRHILQTLFRVMETPENIIQFMVYSFNRHNGEINWQKVVREQYPHESHHKDGSWAPASCVTDGEHVIAFFGSFGLYCFDMNGNLIWEKDLGNMKIAMAVGEGASPTLYEDKLILVWDHEKQSRISP